MKRNLLIAAVLGALTASSFGQGQIGFTAGGGKIKYTTDGVTLINVPTGNPDNVPGFGQVNLAFYSASNGTVLNTISSAYSANTPDFTGWTIQTSGLFHSVLPTAGSISPGTAVLNASSGSPAVAAQIEIVAWTGAFTTFAQALGGGGLVGWTGSTLSGGAFSWSNPTGDGGSIVAATTTGVGGFNGLVLTPSVVPEPGTIVLGGLGAAALLLFRRRK